MFDHLGRIEVGMTSYSIDAVVELEKHKVVYDAVKESLTLVETYDEDDNLDLKFETNMLELLGPQVADWLAEEIAENDGWMDALYRQGKKFLSTDWSAVRSYGSGINLLSNKKFRQAWKKAETRAEALKEDKDE